MGTSELDEFLRRTGAVEILVEIGHGSATFQNINEAALASSSTVSTRLSEGVECDLLEIEHKSIDHGTQKRYALSETGERVYAWILELDLQQTVRKLQRVQRKRDSQVEQLRDYVNRDETLAKERIDPHASVTEAEIERLSQADDVAHKEKSQEQIEAERREKLHSDLVGEENEDDQ